MRRQLVALVDRLTGDDPRGSKFFAWLYAARFVFLGQGPVLAAGVALFALLATIPTLSAVVSLYSFFADAHDIREHLSVLTRVLPRAVVEFLVTQLQRQAESSTGELSFRLVVSLLLSMYSARSTASALIEAINEAYRIHETRSTRYKVVLTLGIAGVTLVGIVVTLIIFVILPLLFAVLPGLRFFAELVPLLRWPILFAVLLVAFAALFRVAPAPRSVSHRSLWPGAFLSTVVWLLTSFGFSLWVENVADYNASYGAFASVIVVIMWFFLSVIAVLIGAFLNAELERRANAPSPTLF